MNLKLAGDNRGGYCDLSGKGASTKGSFFLSKHRSWKVRWKHNMRSDESMFQLVFGKDGSKILHAKDLTDHQLHQFPQHGWLQYVCRYYGWGGVCRDFKETFAAIEAVSFPKKSMDTSERSFVLYVLQFGILYPNTCAWTTCLQSRSVSYWKWIFRKCPTFMLLHSWLRLTKDVFDTSVYWK